MTLREVENHHRQNHAMLLVLLREAHLPLSRDDRERFEAELAEIARSVEAITRATHEHAVAAWSARADRLDRRLVDRRRGDRRRPQEVRP